MKMSLAELRLVLENKEKELMTLLQRRNECLVNVYKKTNGNKELMHEKHEFTVDELTQKIAEVRKAIRKLRLCSTIANVNTLVDFTVDGEKTTLQEAIFLIKQYRVEAENFRTMSEKKATSKIVDPLCFSSNSNVDRSYEEITEPTYNTKLYREKAEKLEKLITKLELAINKANLTTEVEVDFLPGEE
jgi:hypothetical protein